MPLHVVVVVSGVNAKGENFEERAETLEVSKHGAKIRIAHDLKTGALLTIVRPDSDGKAQFRVVYQTPSDPATGKRESGVEFVGVETFWGVQFPPDKWQWA